MSNVQIDINKIVESLVNQISQQAQRIAVLEATIDAIQKTPDKKKTANKPVNQEKE